MLKPGSQEKIRRMFELQWRRPLEIGSDNDINLHCASALDTAAHSKRLADFVTVRSFVDVSRLEPGFSTVKRTV